MKTHHRILFRNSGKDLHGSVGIEEGYAMLFFCNCGQKNLLRHERRKFLGNNPIYRFKCAGKQGCKTVFCVVLEKDGLGNERASRVDGFLAEVLWQKAKKTACSPVSRENSSSEFTKRISRMNPLEILWRYFIFV